VSGKKIRLTVNLCEIFLADLFSSELSQFKNEHPSEDLKFNYLGIFQSLKLRILMEKTFQFLLS